MWDLLAIGLAVLSYALLVVSAGALWPLVGGGWKPATRAEEAEPGVDSQPDAV